MKRTFSCYKLQSSFTLYSHWAARTKGVIRLRCSSSFFSWWILFLSEKQKNIFQSQHQHVIFMWRCTCITHPWLRQTRVLHIPAYCPCVSLPFVFCQSCKEKDAEKVTSHWNLSSFVCDVFFQWWILLLFSGCCAVFNVDTIRIWFSVVCSVKRLLAVDPHVSAGRLCVV